MVAISMYRGNLHRVTDAPPRRWLMPTHNLSVKNFKSLLRRRKHALSVLLGPSNNPNPVKIEEREEEQQQKQRENERAVEDAPPTCSSIEPKTIEAKIEEIEEATREIEVEVKEEERKGDDDRGEGGSEGGDCAEEVDAKKEGGDAVDGSSPVAKKAAEEENPNPETNKTAEAPNDRTKRKREVEERLQILNAKKHNLVQALKQILHAEEELKRRNSMQGMATPRPPVPLQVDVSNDSGVNLGGPVEGGEAEDGLTHNAQSRHLLRMSSASPSSESPLRRPAFMQHNMAPYPSRASPRFPPTGHQAHHGNPPTVSVSGTSYIASSHSPAGSGGTSVFRDTRLPSPWN